MQSGREPIWFPLEVVPNANIYINEYFIIIITSIYTIYSALG